MSDAIISLAVLKANWQTDKSTYVDNFNVLTTECLRRSTEDVVSAQDVRDNLETYFGIRVPLKTVATLLRRAAKKGIVDRDQGIYRVNREKVEKVKFAQHRERFLSLYEKLIEDLIRFANKSYSLEWAKSDAESSAHSYLASHSLTLFRALRNKTLIPMPKGATKSQKYIFAAYVNNLVESNEAILDYVDTVLEGHMLATAVFLPDPGSTKAKFKNTYVYFDTNFALSALGHAGKSLEAPKKELLEILYEFGADLCCFDHTYDEIISVLRGCAANLRASTQYSGYGSTFDYFLSKGFNESDVLLLIERLESDMKRIRIGIKNTPTYVAKYVVDEVKLKDRITNELNYSNLSAMKRDLDSLTAIIRLRGHSQAVLIERSKAIFVTTNTALVRAANEFLRFDMNSNEPPLAISDWDLMNLLWLKGPVRAPSLPRKRLLADCYAAVQPSDDFRKRYFDEVEKLVSFGKFSASDVYALRHSLEAEKIAMDLSVGDEDSFTEGTVQEVLEIYHNRIKGEEQAARKAAEEKARELAQEVGKQESQQLNRETSCEERAVVVSKKLSIFCVCCMIILAVVGTYYTVPLLPSVNMSFLGVEIRFVAILFVLLLSLSNWIWGTTIMTLCRKIEKFFLRPLLKMFRWAGGIE